MGQVTLSVLSQIFPREIAFSPRKNCGSFNVSLKGTAHLCYVRALEKHIYDVYICRKVSEHEFRLTLMVISRGDRVAPFHKLLNLPQPFFCATIVARGKEMDGEGGSVRRVPTLNQLEIYLCINYY